MQCGERLSYFSFGESGVRVVLDFCCSQCVILKFPMYSPTYNSSLCLIYVLLNIVLLGTFIAGPILAFLWFYVCLMKNSILGSLQFFGFCLNDANWRGTFTKKNSDLGRHPNKIIWISLYYILYIKATVMVSVFVGSAWKILLVTARSLWSFPRCNFPRCNWHQRKKKLGAVWFFEAKDLVDQKKNI